MPRKVSRKRSSAAQARSFEPVAGPEAIVLILGSMPGARSLADNQYYAHPRNAFWPIVGTLFGFDAQAPYRARLDALAGARLALWDVLARCERPGSLDSNIVPASVVANDFAGLLGRLPQLRAICFNGGTAQSMWRRYVAPDLGSSLTGIDCRRLPSTSPAHAAMRFEEKLEAWSEIRDIATGS